MLKLLSEQLNWYWMFEFPNTCNFQSKCGFTSVKVGVEIGFCYLGKI